MIESEAFVQALEDIGFDFFTGVPDVLLAGVIETLLTRRLYTPAVREDEAVAMAAGAYLGGRVPAVLMSNAGLGTSLNTLLSLNLLYRHPCLLIVAWRGFEGHDAPEHRSMGQVMTPLLDTVRIPHRTLSDATALDDFNWVAQTFMKTRIPVALLLKPGVVRGIQP
ncbi:MAG: sulfopyruvate decarboxylase subunit alpha [Nitrospirae bacterium]|nr:MAG: sulfopyruvate decarboxylase subunit alpha [Nitrospirota bacterium]